MDVSVLYYTYRDSDANTQSFVPVLLNSVLREQPALSWQELGSLEYVDSVSLQRIQDQGLAYHFFGRFKIAAQTVYMGQDSMSSNFHFNFNAIARNWNPGIIRVVGGPIHSGLAEHVLIQSNADFFFSGSALWSFRKFCEHTQECLEQGKPIDREYLQMLPGLFQRKKDGTIIHPYSHEQHVDFIRELELFPKPLLEYADSRAYQKNMANHQVSFPYPVYNVCRTGCSFCDYSPVGVPLSHGQRMDYARKMVAGIERYGTLHLNYFDQQGPYFDFRDEGYFGLVNTLESGFGVCSRVVSFLEPGKAGQRTPNTSLLSKLVENGMSHLELGIESSSRSRRKDMGKPDFTNEELLSVLSKLAELNTIHRKGPDGRTKQMYISLDIVPADALTEFLDIFAESINFLNFFVTLAFSENKNPGLICAPQYSLTYLQPMPDTPDFHILSILHERFPKLMEAYYNSEEFGNNLFRTKGSNKFPYLYDYSIPFDPIARVVGYAVNWCKGNMSSRLSYFDEKNNLALIFNYFSALATLSCLEYYSSKHADRYTSDHAKALEHIRKGLSPDFAAPEREVLIVDPNSADNAVFSCLTVLNDIYFKKRGFDELEFSIATTPLNDPKFRQFSKKLRSIRRSMTRERQRGNQNWKAVAIA
jgi:hypothetical protein